MGTEIEHKYLVDPKLLPMSHIESPRRIIQGYLTPHDGTTVRVRIVEAATDNEDDEGYLTIKGPGLELRKEFEYPIPVDDARDMIEHLSMSKVSKVRWYATVGPYLWEVDQFEDHLQGLWVAEIELASTSDKYEVPEWATKDVTLDRRFTNVWLAKHGIPRCAAL